MINKQSVWFVTLFSLIIVLAIYYVTLNDSSLQNILNMSEKEKETSLVNVNVEESSLNAYNSLMSLNQKKSEEEKIEKKIKEEFQLDSFVKIKKDTISITIAAKEHNSTLANNIIRSIQKMYDIDKYITVKFQNA